MSDRSGSRAGALLRRWRTLRGKSQMELALDAGFSARHVSFVETGRSRPSRDAVLALSEVLRIPLRDRNVILEAAGHARAYDEVPLHHPDRDHLRRLVGGILARQDPWFAVAIDHRWDIMMANERASGRLDEIFGPGGVPGPRNLIRMTLHPRGLRPAIRNLGEVGRPLVDHLRRETIRRPDDDRLAGLLREVEGYGDLPPGGDPGEGPSPIVLETGGGTARLLTVVMEFANPLDPLMEEIRIETYVPADEETADLLSG